MVVILASASATSACAAGVTLGIVALQRSLDRFLPLLFLTPFAVPAVGLAILIALALLRPTRLRISIPIVAGVTVALTAIGTVSHPFIGACVGLVGGILAMFVVALIPGLREAARERRLLGAPCR